MSFVFRCPACVSGSLTSRVTVKDIQNRVLVSGAFFNESGVIIPPTLKSSITTLCSNGHTIVNIVSKIPQALSNNIEFFVDTP